MKWVLLALALVAVVAAGAGYLFRGEIALALMQRMVERTMAANAMAEMPDGLHVGLCGAGAPMPSPNRSGPCVVVMAGQRLIVIDSGTGGSRTLARMGFDAGQIDSCDPTEL